ncbi:MAG: dihydroneopterin aldolase [Actinobacteria bacterium]|nr:dihydroneopterin aldolase [Actinomycetota bacterium]MCL6104937.1 dihydroneopterin aldolase [Actinomycetota bacterium]
MGRHGVHAFERQYLQPFEVDLEVKVDLSSTGTTDSLDNTVDYATLADKVERVVAGNTFYLLETVADSIVSEVLKDSRIQAVTVAVYKLRPQLNVHLDKVGVKIEKTRTAGSE